MSEDLPQISPRPPEDSCWPPGRLNDVTYQETLENIIKTLKKPISGTPNAIEYMASSPFAAAKGA